MKTEIEKQGIKESLAEALEESGEGRPDLPTMPLVGSENVPISKEEEKYVEQ